MIQGWLRRLNKSALFFLLAILAAFLLSASPAIAEDIKNEDCLACHTDFQADRFASSVHTNNLCTSCHKDIHEIPHPEKLTKVDCGSCHRMEAQVYHASDHGKALASGIQAASCLDCHGSLHHIFSATHPK